MERWVFFTLLMIATQISDVDAGTRNSDIIGMAVAGCVSVVLLSVVIAYIVITFHWRKWFNGWMLLKGKTRMPRAYFQKKEDAKRRLISTTAPSRSNVGLSNPSVYETVPDVKAWTLGSTHMTPYMVYEDKDATIELGEEDEEIFTIETEVMDEEAPKVASVFTDRTPDPTVEDKEDEEEHIYSMADSFKKIKQAEADFRESMGAVLYVPDTFLPEEDAQQGDDEDDSANSVRITSF